ncbi:MAG: hypothetical protein K1X75_00890 [Leptospirales bacterium]|nr:hypothetical protein [Leptospirales bacterium]
MRWLSDLSEFANPLASRMYKLVVSLPALNPILQKYVAQPSRTIESLSVGSSDGTVVFRGIYLPREDHTLASLGYKRVGFLAETQPLSNEGSLVRLAIRKFRLLDPSEATVDLMRLASKFVPAIQRRFAQSLARTAPAVFSAPSDDGDTIAMNMDYFLERVPGYTSMLGELRLMRVFVRTDERVVFFVQTNLILRQLAEFFGPQFISIEELEDRDHIEALWQDAAP